MPAPSSIPTESLQKEHYIRTYAMDLARVTKQPPPQSNIVPKPKVDSAPAPGIVPLHKPIPAPRPAPQRRQGRGFFEVLAASLLPHPRANVATAATEPIVKEDDYAESDDSLITHVPPPQAPELSELEHEAELSDQRAADAEREISAELNSIQPQKPEPINLPSVVPTQTASSPSATAPIMQAAPAVQLQPKNPADDRELILARLREHSKAAEQKASAQLDLPAPENELALPAAAAIPSQEVKSINSAQESGGRPAFTEDERDAMLERLRARINENSPTPVKPAIPTAPLSVRSALPAKPVAPAQMPTGPYQVPVLPEKVDASPIATPQMPQQFQSPNLAPELPVIPTASIPTYSLPQPTYPRPPQAPQFYGQVPGQPAPFHSFSSDFATRVDTQGASTFSVLAAQRDAAPAQPAPRSRKVEWLPIVAGIVLIVGGAVGVLAAYHYMQSKAPVAISPTVPSLIKADEYVPLTGTYLAGALMQVTNQPLTQGEVVVTYVNLSTTTQQGVVQIPQPGGTLIADLHLPAPDILLRNVDESSTVGVVNDGTDTKPFFLLHVISYDRTFTGMLTWESTMANDLSQYYPAYPAAITGTSTATTTQNAATTTALTIAAPLEFTDEVVGSHSVRVLRDAQGRSLMLYGYTADKQTLIIARDEQAFTILLGRLSASGSGS